MNHDVFLCYDERDVEVAERTCELFEANNIRCWFKSRDYSPDEPGSKVFDAIGHAKAFVVLYSKNSKNSESVNREVNNVFSTETKIMVFNIDDTSYSGKLEYYLKDKYSLVLFPNPSGKLKQLLRDVSETVSKPISRVDVSRSTVKFFKQFDPHPPGLLKYVKIAVPVVIVLALVVWFLVIPSGLHTTDDGQFRMNISNVDVKNLNGKYVYTVLGDAYNMPSDSDRYIMQLNFYDKDKNQVYEVNSTCDEFKGRVITTFNRPNDNITTVDFELVDFSDNVICNQTIKIS
jgi:hypothetical protein